MILRYRLFGFLLLVAIAASLAQTQAQEWTRFRGENGSGVSNAKSIPTTFSESSIQWRIKLAGAGHASPVVWREHVYIVSADDATKKRYVQCFAATDGAEIWRKEYSFAPGKKHKQNSFASCTPACDDTHLYVLWQSTDTSNVTAYTHDGEVAWVHDLGDWKAGHGSAVSPVVFDGAVYICNDQQGPSSLLALNSNTGEPIWRIPRDTTRACYSTPCVYRPQGREPEIVFTHSYQGITSHNAKTGAEIWRIKPFGEFKQRACASPIVAGDYVIGVSGFATSEKNVVVVRPNYSENGASVEELYRISKQAPHVPTPIVYRDHIYLWTDRGIASCFKLADGELVWQKRIGGNYFGSPVCINGNLYCVDVDGVIVVIAANPVFQEISRNPLGEGSCATPAVAGERMFIRTDTQLICIAGE